MVIATTTNSKGQPTWFVKRIEKIIETPILGKYTHQMALSMEKRKLIGQFTSLCSSPKAMAIWIQQNRQDHLKEQWTHFFCGCGCYVFLFQSKEDKYLIFRSRPYFMGTSGMYLNWWTLNFNPENDIPFSIPVWVWLSHLPIHCWNDKTLKCIGDTLRKYIDKTTPKEGIFSCAKICVEVDLEKGLPKVILLTLDNLWHEQPMDFE